MSAPTPLQIVRQLRVQLAEQEHAAAIAFWNIPQLTRADILRSMSVPCWEDACHDCPGGAGGSGCVCECHDEPALCRERLEAATAEYFGRQP